MSVNSERRDGNCVREDVQVKILIFSANFFFQDETVSDSNQFAFERKWEEVK